MWTKEKVMKEALKLTTMKEWRSNKALSSAASRLGVRKEATAHIPRETKRYEKNISKEAMLALASTFKCRSDFQKEHPALYKKVTPKDLEKIFGKPYREARKQFKDDEAIQLAKNYGTRNQLKRENLSLYNFIRQYGLEDKAFAHMGKALCLKYTYEELRQEALKYTTKQSFKLGSYGEYQAAYRHEKFNDICSHMVPGKIATNYDKPMWLYIVKITTLDGSLPVVYKIGITKRSYILDRFWIDYDKNRTVIEVLFKNKYEKGKDAYNMEQSIKEEFKNFKYNGKSPLKRTKTTEMFTTNIGLRECEENGQPLE